MGVVLIVCVCWIIIITRFLSGDGRGGAEDLCVVGKRLTAVHWIMKQLVCTDIWLFSDLSPDSHGNQYITDYKNSCIRVFSIDSDFLHFFFCDGNEVKKFIGPDGECVCVCVHVCDVCARYCQSTSTWLNKVWYWLSVWPHRAVVNLLQTSWTITMLIECVPIEYCQPTSTYLNPVLC